MDDEVMSIKQVAKYLQIHPVTVYRHLKSKKIKMTKIGNVWRAMKKDIDQMLSPK